MTEAKEKLDRLRAKRGGHRGVCTKLAKETDELLHLPGDIDVDRSEIIRSLLEAKLKILSEIDEEILGLCDVNDIEQEIDESAEVLARILNAKRKLERAVNSKVVNDGQNQVTSQLAPSQANENTSSTHGTAAEGDNQSSSEASQNELNTSQGAVNTSTSQPTAISTVTTTTIKPKLPKLTLAKFKGEVTKWNTFWDSYESAIHNNDAITKVDKFNYLTSLLEGTALRAVQGLTLTNVNYDNAIEILHDRFGRPQQVIAAHMDEILKIQTCNGEKLSSLRYIYDKICVHVRSLASLGVSSQQYGSLLIPIIMSKLPNDIRLQIARKAPKETWKIDDLLSTIKLEIEARETSEATKSSVNNQQVHKRNNAPTANAMVVKSGKHLDSSKIQCVYCGDYHYSASCEKVVSVEARKKVLGESRRCFNCLRKGHNARDCANTKTCRHCQGKHHQSICSQNQKVDDVKPTEKEEQKVKTKEPTTTATRICKGTVLLQTARANATNGARSTPVRVLFDTGSQRSYITNATQEKLRLLPIKKETLYLNTFGDNKCKRQACEVYKFNLESKTGSEVMEITAITFPVICSPLNSKVNTSHAHLEGLELADYDDDDKGDTIDILIGADHYWDVITGDVVRGENGPTAISSKLGWLLSGQVPTSVESEDPTVSNLILTGEPFETSRYSNAQRNDDKIVDSLKRFWETESIGITDYQQESSGNSNFIRDIRFTGERYEVRLPWKEECLEIEDDYKLCHNQLLALRHRLMKHPELLREYDEGIQQQLERGVIERVPQRSDDDEVNRTGVHYLPHHGVVRKDKETTKLRVVYNGSATTASRTRSLNDCFLTGPNYIPRLFDILVKFRLNPVGLVADIEKAFLMVGVDEVDRDMLRFLWFKSIHDPKPEIVEYRFSRLVFGLRPSPAILGATIDHHLHFYEGRKPEIVDILKDSLYVDDLVSGASNDGKAFDIYKDAKKIMLEGGFNLRKWNSNSSTLVERIVNAEKKVEENATVAQESAMEEDLSYAKASIGLHPNTTEDKLVKVLGLPWDINSDEFVLSLSALASYARTLPTTKRTVLKVTAKIFDPIGFLSPFTIRMKELFQRLCTEGVDWDDDLNGSLLTKWNAILNELSDLENVRIPRCYSSSDAAPTKVELHGFSDASKAAIAAVVYWRALYEDGHAEVKLVASKTKVAPLKTQTIPRLELLGATILARLITTVRNCLSSNENIDMFNWTDSRAVLCWITTDKP